MSTLARSLDVVREVAEHGPLSVAVIAARVSVPLSSAYRIVNSLVHLGYLSPPDKAARYAIGPKAAELAELVRQQSRKERGLVVEEALHRAAPSSPGYWLRRVAGQVIDALDGQDVADRAVG